MNLGLKQPGFKVPIPLELWASTFFQIQDVYSSLYRQYRIQMKIQKQVFHSKKQDDKSVRKQKKNSVSIKYSTVLGNKGPIIKVSNKVLVSSYL